MDGGRQGKSPEAEDSNMSGVIRHAPRLGNGSMEFGNQVVRLWERPAEQLLAADLGVVPLAMLGRLPEGASLEDGPAAITERVTERVTAEAPPGGQETADGRLSADRPADP